MRKCSIILVLMLATFLLSSCGDPHASGIILESSDEQLLLAQNMTPKDYNEVKNELVTDLRNKDVNDESPSLGLMEITYKRAHIFTKGEEVNVWIKGDIMSSYPAQAEAKKIKLKK